MTSIDRTAYPRLRPRPSKATLSELWSPKPEEVALGRASTRGEDQLLGFVLMLKSFRRLGYWGEDTEPALQHQLVRRCATLHVGRGRE